VSSVVEALGRIDVLVNNAGVFPLAPALDLSEATWERVFGVNLKGAFFLAQTASQQMIRQGDGGAIVNIASLDALHPSGTLLPSDASKGGMIAMTRSLARELGPHRVRVNAVAPGVVQTPGEEAALRAMSGGSAGQLKAQLVSHTPLGRLGSPDDVARAVLFLASAAADWITGTTLVVDGGALLT
jgi:NAD(P)-dependent dehydrogenase (short-subunit alcohol dehydrogenase family)